MSDGKTLRAVMIMTSHGELGQAGRKTGVWLESFAAPYFTFRDAGIELTLASPAGGMPPIDPLSRQIAFPAAARFADDDCCRAALADTLCLADLYAADFDAAFFCGGYGAYWDLAEDDTTAALVTELHATDKPFAMIGAGVAALCKARDRAGRPVAETRRIAVLPDQSLRDAGVADSLPFSLRQRLSTLGAVVEQASETPTLRDGLLVTSASDAGGDTAAGDLLHIVRSKQSH